MSAPSKMGRPWFWVLLLVAAWLPFMASAQEVIITPTALGDPQDFGDVAVGQASANKTYSISGSNLNNDITIVIPAGFQGSLNNGTTFTNNDGAQLTVARSGNSASGTLTLRFVPKQEGQNQSTLYASTNRQNGPPVFSNFVSLKGNGIPGAPTITVNPEALAFGNQIVGTTSASKSFTVNGTSLGTTPITVNAPTGFLVSYNGSAFGSTASINPTNGSVSNAVVNVQFNPATAKSYIELITLASSTASNSVSVSGTGTLPTPSLTATPSTLQSFGSVTVGTTSGTTIRSFVVNGQNLQGNVTITAPAGFSIRIGSGLFSSQPIVLTPVDGTLANTTIDVRFSPTTATAYAADITVASPSAVTQLVRVTGTGTPSSGSPVIRVDPAAIAFGTVTGSGSTSTRTFEVSGTDLVSGIVLTPSSANIELRNASTGGSFTKTLTINQVNGTVSAQTIEVRLVAIVPQNDFNQRIDITSQGAAAKIVGVTATNPSGATSDISVVNVDNNDFTFATRPNTVSASQRFLVSGTNLVDNLVVRPVGPNAEYFEVSTDDVNFFPSVSFTPNTQGNVLQTTVYVHFKPGVQAVTVTSTIRNSSAPAPDFDVSVTGISEPTIRLNQPIGNFATNVVKGTVTAPVAVRAVGFLLDGEVGIRFPQDFADDLRNPTRTPQYEFSFDNGKTYVKESSITPDANGNFTQDLLVRFAPVRVGNADQTLQFKNASLQGGAYFNLTSGFGRAQGFAIAVEPTAQSTAKVVRSANGQSATITFDLTSAPAGTAYGATRLVIGSSTYTTELPTNLFPQDKQNFNPGTTLGNGDYRFGSGTAIEANTNTFVVFSGASGSFTVTNLDPKLTYSFFGFEFNNDGVLNAENYRIPNNRPQFPLPVDLVSFTAKLRNNKVALNWVTASEKNNGSFAVERSQDARTFNTILTREGKGTTSTSTTYDAIDEKPLTGTSYYRLKQIDFDGTVKYSSPVAVNNLGVAEVAMYPNPTEDVLNIQIGGSTEGVRASVSDLTGRVVLTQVLSGNGQLSLGGLRSGTYLVTVGEGNSKVTRRIVKK
ncbi:Por secretion system C-terminal sorting domain-containing protein [Hymenobacter gelipurpurascens]|uniref:Por secretion system C-terminal sorting domain-containing protein n=2 Tax=Hymenobacter gelipurpurascens TaxID=89968 RepID=A0A212T2X4_9BACT|nr:Por secretion system C-terminal sorting domain-containing protein [Hymenobacter gelipurpurascens]